jgi:hypothetical protein
LVPCRRVVCAGVCVCVCAVCVLGVCVCVLRVVSLVGCGSCTTPCMPPPLAHSRRPRPRTHTHTHAHTHTHTHTQGHATPAACLPPSPTHTHTHTHMHARTCLLQHGVCRGRLVLEAKLERARAPLGLLRVRRVRVQRAGLRGTRPVAVWVLRVGGRRDAKLGGARGALGDLLLPCGRDAAPLLRVCMCVLTPRVLVASSTLGASALLQHTEATPTHWPLTQQPRAHPHSPQHTPRHPPLRRSRCPWQSPPA